MGEVRPFDVLAVRKKAWLLRSSTKEVVEERAR